MFTIFTGKDVVDSIKYWKNKSKKESTERKIYEEILNDNILVCNYCCGFVDKEVGECPHCYKSLGLMDNKTLAIKTKEYSKDKVIQHINEGIYIGRYSRNQEIILEN